LFSRAKKHLADNRPRFRSTREEHDRLLYRFLNAAQAGDLQGLTNLLAEDVTIWTDGGGKVAAAKRPIQGRISVATVVANTTKFLPAGSVVEMAQVNGELSAVVRTPDRKAFVVLTCEVGDGQITALRIIGNPDKLARI
jgi:RNA polymerase sigma-70 factor (ECF subfamily)